MADTLLLRALKTQPKVLNLCNKGLDRVPKLIGKLSGVVQVQLKNNKIKLLPPEFAELIHLEVLNLGNNSLEDLPNVLIDCISLVKLHVFNNQIRSINPKVLSNLRSLTVLNLNNNQLETLPPEVCRLTSLQILSLDDNQLTELPFEICALKNLTELRCPNNELIALPLEFGYLTNLEKLYVQKNKLKELPESLGKCYKLRVLDIAANELRIFPTEFSALPLKELYCEENPLLRHVPVHSMQEEEVLSLKEITSRFVMKELKDRWSYLRRAIRHYPNIREMLSQSSKCAVCEESFLNTWLECVRFVDSQKTLKTKLNTVGVVPVRALLCSYRCFNKEGHQYYGVAFP